MPSFDISVDQQLLNEYRNRLFETLYSRSPIYHVPSYATTGTHYDEIPTDSFDYYYQQHSVAPETEEQRMVRENTESYERNKLSRRMHLREHMEIVDDIIDAEL